MEYISTSGNPQSDYLRSEPWTRSFFPVSKKSIVKLDRHNCVTHKEIVGHLKAKRVHNTHLCIPDSFWCRGTEIIICLNASNTAIALPPCFRKRQPSRLSASLQTPIFHIEHQKKKRCLDFRFIGAVKDMSDHIATSDSLPPPLHYYAVDSGKCSQSLFWVPHRQVNISTDCYCRIQTENLVVFFPLFFSSVPDRCVRLYQEADSKLGWSDKSSILIRIVR